ncbi:hypothetical protein ACMA5I_06630 [Paracoccaceae bacterium GXU_MW_L88]
MSDLELMRDGQVIAANDIVATISWVSTSAEAQWSGEYTRSPYWDEWGVNLEERVGELEDELEDKDNEIAALHIIVKEKTAEIAKLKAGASK